MVRLAAICAKLRCGYGPKPWFWREKLGFLAFSVFWVGGITNPGDARAGFLRTGRIHPRGHPQVQDHTERARSTTVARTHPGYKNPHRRFRSPGCLRACTHTRVGGGRVCVRPWVSWGVRGLRACVRAAKIAAGRQNSRRFLTPSPDYAKNSTSPGSQRSPAPAMPQHWARGHRTIIGKVGPGRASCTENLRNSVSRKH